MRARSAFSWFLLMQTCHLGKVCCVPSVCCVSGIGHHPMHKVDLPSQSCRLDGKMDRKKAHKGHHRADHI